MVEHFLAKEDVGGSNPLSRSKPVSHIASSLPFPMNLYQFGGRRVTLTPTLSLRERGLSEVAY